MRVIDLFSGLGGFSQAFLDRGHEVIRYDFNPDFQSVENTIIKDVRELTSADLQGADIILASIDCTYFTYANSNPDKEGLEQFEKIARHTLRIIQDARPKYYVIENPPGRLKWILGKPVIKTAWGYWGTPYLKPTWLWGNLPDIEWRTRYKEPLPKPTWNLKTFKNHKFAYLCKREPKIRSLIPYAFSKAVCIAVERGIGKQETLT